MKDATAGQRAVLMARARDFLQATGECLDELEKDLPKPDDVTKKRVEG
jgi:hypothetical protein